MIIKAINSDIKKQNQVPFTPKSADKIYAEGIKNTTCLITEAIRLYISLFVACMTELNIILKPTIGKWRDIALNANDPTSIILSLALKRASIFSGKKNVINDPINIMTKAAFRALFMTLCIRSLLCEPKL